MDQRLTGTTTDHTDGTDIEGQFTMRFHCSLAHLHPFSLPGQLPHAADPRQKLRHTHRLEHIIAIARGGPPRPENTGGATTGLPSTSPAPSLCNPIRGISEIRG